LRILNAEPRDYSEAARKFLREIGTLEEAELDRSALLACIGEYDVLIVRLAHSVDRELLEAATRLSVVVTATTGLDHIDLGEAAARGVTVLSLRGEHAFLSSVSSTAELTWALLLALVRRLMPAFDHVRQGGWDRDQFRGVELQGMRLGIVGVGRVGTMVARYGRAFAMNVAAFDPDPLAWPEGVERVESLDQLAMGADVLTVHAPLDESTQGLIDRNVLLKLPRGAFLVNTARAAILDGAALLELLESGHLAGAAIDVLDAERDEAGLRNHPLIEYARTHENLLVTPHIAGASTQAMERTEVFMAEKLRDHVAAMNQENQK
jgi:D-3-phosphoglycerate dehydrogenase